MSNAELITRARGYGTNDSFTNDLIDELADALDAAEAMLAKERAYGGYVAGQRDSAISAIIYGPIVAPPWLLRYAEKGAK
ncbi:hypothetical protein E3T54_03020 [Cryobacterium sp. Sr8]|uniref:hypothetical protein n=1 Tax=Cryobacterium sp. Sr8 TaxID=1259203 RepID=UPI00106D2A5B|nr:hypothetical protein [Cryobacterium sp. Sr8]TFD80729.1 hypothetical protein E3T54_03020 [Cryobacterium sp. Sr8]